MEWTVEEDVMVVSPDDEEGDDLLLRRLILCEEDRRRLFPAMPWTGGYRWFKSPNVVDLEAYRRRGGLVTWPFHDQAAS
jgi:hypothetical protein